MCIKVTHEYKLTRFRSERRTVDIMLGASAQHEEYLVVFVVMRTEILGLALDVPEAKAFRVLGAISVIFISSFFCNVIVP